MKLIVDRIEGNIVVCEAEDRKMINLPIAMFSEEVKSGDIINISNDDGMESLTIAAEETGQRKKEMQSRFDKLFKNG